MSGSLARTEMHDAWTKVALADAPEATGHVVTLVTAHARLLRIDQHEPGLEEVFLQLTGDHAASPVEDAAAKGASK